LNSFQDHFLSKYYFFFLLFIIMAAKCDVCQKTAYPMESLAASGHTYHKLCFKCSVCQQTLNLKNYKMYEKQIYCSTHTPKPKGSSTGTDSIHMKSALNAPKKTVASGVQKNDPRVAPTHSNDFTVNEARDQSTENAPAESAITYEQHDPDQSRENEPQASDVSYEQSEEDQSRE